MSIKILGSAAMSLVVAGLLYAADDPKPAAPGRAQGNLKAPAGSGESSSTAAVAPPRYPDRVELSDREWRRRLSPMTYYVTRLKGTERAGTGRYSRGHYRGLFACADCGADLFSSKTKFESGTGWPSFYSPIRETAVATAADYSLTSSRVEVTCAVCDAHLGHVFNDGPAPTGLRYCMNSAALQFKPVKTARPKTPSKSDSESRPKSETGEARSPASDRPEGGDESPNR